MRQACYHLYTEVGKKFPDLCSTAVGGFFCLRFVCPAIIAPEQYQLVSGALSATSRRILVLVSKLLQNISNGVTGSSKERFMTLMNDFVQNSSAKLNQFFSLISVSSLIHHCTPMQHRPWLLMIALPTPPTLCQYSNIHNLVLANV
jgi:hypothetical protein